MHGGSGSLGRTLSRVDRGYLMLTLLALCTTSLEQARIVNEKELANFRQTQEDKKKMELRALDDFFANRSTNSEEQIRYDTEIIQNEHKQKLDDFDWQIAQQELLIANVKMTNEQKANEESKLAELRVKKATEVTDAIYDAQKRGIALEKDINAQKEEDAKKLADANIAKAEEAIHKDNMASIAQANADIEVAIKEKKFDRIKTIEDNLTQVIIENEVKRLKALIANGNLSIEQERNVQARINQLTETYGKNKQQSDIDISKVNFDAKQELHQKEAELINAGFDSQQQIYSNQLDAATKQHDYELQLAGDSVEGKIIADRKYEEERKKIQRRQAIAEKEQAAFNIVLNTIQGISNVWKISGILPPVAAALSAVIGAIGAVQLATVLSKPIPAFFKGTDNLQDATFIAGEQGSEAIIKPSGEVLLTPDKATMFSDKSFIGSTILPHDKTQQMLANYAVTQGSQVFLDMNKTNSILSSMDRKMNGKDEKFIDGRGNLTIKRGNTTTHYATV